MNGKVRQQLRQHIAASEIDTSSLSGSDESVIYMAHLENDLRVTGRSIRIWIAAKNFPPPDGNLFGRNFWKLGTYRRWKADRDAGKFSMQRRPGSTISPPTA